MTVEAILLGTAQDGGVPQAGCGCPQCAAAQADPGQRRLVACLGLVDRAAGQSWLIDATPDFRRQLQALHELAPGCALSGIFLTHAHVGHYAGLIHLGREAWNTQGMPLYVSPRMATFLRDNAPWSQLVALGNVRLQLLLPGSEFWLGPALSLLPLTVPHRDEFSDTLAFVLRGPSRRLFYCPDIDGWEEWEHDLRGFLSGIDVALLDGTFFSDDELPGRDIKQVPHPRAVDTAGRLAGVDCAVWLVHLNHTNPLHRPGRERDSLVVQGVGVGTFAQRWRLDR